jgi:hypothetical protein
MCLPCARVFVCGGGGGADRTSREKQTSRLLATQATPPDLRIRCKRAEPGSMRGVCGWVCIDNFQHDNCQLLRYQSTRALLQSAAASNSMLASHASGAPI